MNCKITILALVMTVTVTASAQTSRRTIEKWATEAVKQKVLTGRTPTIDILDSLANNAEVGIEMLSRMGDPDDRRQYNACLRLIDETVDYALTPTGRKYTDVVRIGLKKALDRSYDTEVQRHVMEQLARCAKPADAAHIAMYLEVPELAPTAQAILLPMRGIDDDLAAAAVAQPGIKTRVKAILDAHAGKGVAVAAPLPTVKAEAVPFWTESLDHEVGYMAALAADRTDGVIVSDGADGALPKLLDMARAITDTAMRHAVIARMLQVEEHSTLAPERRYLLLREADELVSDDNLHRKVIVAMGRTHTIQALVYMRRYYGKIEYADAVAVAAAEILGAHPEANGGNMVRALLYSAKQSFIRHYDELGADAYIDQVLAATDNWRADGGYDMNHTEDTRMEKRGFWIMHEQLADSDIAFDWKADGDLTLFLRSAPVLVLNSRRGVHTANGAWREFRADGAWCTANVSVVADRLTVIVNGQKVVDGERLAAIEPGRAVAVLGTVKFLADDNGATVRQYCFLKR